MVAPATPPVKPDYANTEVPIVSGMMLGFLAACTVGAVLDRLPPAHRRRGVRPPALPHALPPPHVAHQHPRGPSCRLTSTAARPPVSLSRAVRHHLPVVLVFLVLGALAGYLYAGSVKPAYTSTARVLVNPSVGNPFVPTPSSVRQDELTSLETEAQVARSDEVLGAVHTQYPEVSTVTMRRNVGVLVRPPNTQILEITFTAANPETAQTITNAVAAHTSPTAPSGSPT